MAMQLRAAVIETADELARLEPEWEQLLARSSTDEPALSPLWLLTWWAIFGGEGGRRLRVWIARDDGGRLVGLAPLLWRVHWYRPGIPFRRLELLGSGEADRDAIVSEYIGVIAEHGAEAAVASALVRSLRAGELGDWDELICPRMNGEAAATTALIAELRAAEPELDATGIEPALYVRLPASWDDYLAALESTKRYRLRRAMRDFDAWADGASQIHQASTREDIRRGLDVLVRLHGERWEAAGQHGVFSSPRFRRFHEIVMPLLLDRGALELLWLEVRGEPVAAAYNLVWNGRVQFYQSGRKMDVPKKVRPGLVLHAMAIQRAIAAGRTEYDFMGGAVRYKAELATDTRPLVAVRATTGRLLRDRARRAVRLGAQRARALRAALRERSESGWLGRGRDGRLPR